MDRFSISLLWPFSVFDVSTSSENRFPLSMLLLLGACSTIAPLALNMHVPAMGELATALGVERADASLTVTAYLWIFGAGMLFAGIPADRWGRRPTLLVGLGLFALGAALISLIEWSPLRTWLASLGTNDAPTALRPAFLLLLLSRGIQALGAALIVVIPRTMVNDRAQGQRAVQLLGALATIMAAAPALAPIAGAALALNFGWTTIFWAQLLLSVLLLLISFFRLPETQPTPAPSRAEAAQKAEDTKSAESSTPSKVIETYSYHPLPVVIAPVLVMSLLMGVYYAYLAGGADAALMYFDQTPSALAVLLAILSCIYVIGNMLVVRYAALFSPMNWVRVGVILAALSLPMVFVVNTYALTGAAMCVYALGVGMVMPTSLAIAGNVLPHYRAHVMSVASSSPFLIGGALSLLATIFQITTWPRFEWLMTACVALCVLLVLLRRKD